MKYYAFSCPVCRTPFDRSTITNIFINFQEIDQDCEDCTEKDGIIAGLQGALGNLEEDMEHLTLQLQNLCINDDFGGRIRSGKEYADSTCLNCESKEHDSMKCPNPPWIRCQIFK